MPLYEYDCPTCGRFERIQKFADAPLSTCPTCGSDVQKLLSAPAFQFKGTGWYITDYARKSGAGGGDGKSESGKSDAAKGDGGTKAEPAKSASDSSGTASTSTPSTSASPPAAK